MDTARTDGGQSKFESLLEALANQAVGVSYALFFYWYMFGFTLLEGLGTTGFFVVAGLVRIFLVRRIFEYARSKRGQKC
jgi:hypothetical protein